MKEKQQADEIFDVKIMNGYLPRSALWLFGMRFIWRSQIVAGIAEALLL